MNRQKTSGDGICPIGPDGEFKTLYFLRTESAVKINDPRFVEVCLVPAPLLDWVERIRGCLDTTIDGPAWMAIALRELNETWPAERERRI